ncbi:hypothetical protein RB200_30710 [Streptomyces sp. PmtG]
MPGTTRVHTNTIDTHDTGWGRAAARARSYARGAAVGLAVTAVLGGGPALAPEAAAAPTAPAAAAENRTAEVSAAAARGTAPACVQRSVRGRSATVNNRCGRLMRVKIVVKRGPDSRCYALKHRAWARYSWPFGSYDKTVTC